MGPWGWKIIPIPTPYPYPWDLHTHGRPGYYPAHRDRVSCECAAQGVCVLNGFQERLSGRRLYERLHDVLLDSGALHALRVVDADWPATPPAPHVSNSKLLQ